MTDPITSSPLVTPITQLMQASAAPSDKTSLDKDAFLKLLVAQLRYQDPSSPVDSSQFMAQTAQFTQVEKLEQMAKDSTATLSLQQGLAASSLVGRTVSWVDSDGTAHQGVAVAATFGGSLTSEPTVKVGDRQVPLSQITTVQAGG